VHSVILYKPHRHCLLYPFPDAPTPQKPLPPTTSSSTTMAHNQEAGGSGTIIAEDSPHNFTLDAAEVLFRAPAGAAKVHATTRLAHVQRRLRCPVGARGRGAPRPYCRATSTSTGSAVKPIGVGFEQPRVVVHLITRAGGYRVLRRPRRRPIQQNKPTRDATLAGHGYCPRITNDTPRRVVYFPAARSITMSAYLASSRSDSSRSGSPGFAR
jgi:hypothetical protein